MNSLPLEVSWGILFCLKEKMFPKLTTSSMFVFLRPAHISLRANIAF